MNDTQCLKIAHEADRIMDDWTNIRLYLKRDAHTLQDENNIGVKHCAINAKFFDGHLCNLRTQFWCLCHGENIVTLAQFAVLGEAAPGLAHEPDRRSIGLPVMAGIKKACESGVRRHASWSFIRLHVSSFTNVVSWRVIALNHIITCFYQAGNNKS